MNDTRLHLGGVAMRAAAILLVSFSLGALAACDSLLEVDLRSDLTAEALTDPASAPDQMNSFIAHFECGYSSWAYVAAGDEGPLDPRSGLYYASGAHRFLALPETGECDTAAHVKDYFDQIMVSRAMAAALYDRLNGEDAWTVAEVPNKEVLSATSALYAAANLEFLGDYFCDVAIDAGPLMSPDQTLDLANEWVERAFGHIATTGDYEIPHQITPGPGGATALAYALRARILWAQGDLAGAAAAAEMVPQGFVAHVTRGGGLQRRNKVYQQGLQSPYSRLADVVDWWSGQPNPATGEDWPDVIPFTGNIHLGIIPSDGRAVWDDGLPVRVDVEQRDAAINNVEHLKPGDADAVLDSRTPITFNNQILGGGEGWVPTKYTSESDPIPFVNWEEIWLIRAEAAGGQTAIDLVNDIRTAHDLPLVTYADPNDPQQIRYMIMEEKRRSLWMEGRFLATKIENTDIMWFPRQQGQAESTGSDYLGAVRRVLPTDEYNLNPNFSLADRNTMCDPDERAVRPDAT